MEKLIALLFLSRDQAHKMHLSAKMYGEHMHLGEFYDEIVELADDIAEVWQGKHGLMKEVPKMNNEMKPTASATLRSHVEWIESNRYKLCDKDDAMMQSLVDPIIALYYKTLYKLDNLSNR